MVGEGGLKSVEFVIVFVQVTNCVLCPLYESAV